MCVRQVDDRNEKIGRKIRDNELRRIPFLLIVGEKEEAEGMVSVRAQGEGDRGSMTQDEFIAPGTRESGRRDQNSEQVERP